MSKNVRERSRVSLVDALGWNAETLEQCTPPMGRPPLAGTDQWDQYEEQRKRADALHRAITKISKGQRKIAEHMPNGLSRKAARGIIRYSTEKEWLWQQRRKQYVQMVKKALKVSSKPVTAELIHKLDGISVYSPGSADPKRWSKWERSTKDDLDKYLRKHGVPIHESSDGSRCIMCDFGKSQSHEKLEQAEDRNRKWKLSRKDKTATDDDGEPLGQKGSYWRLERKIGATRIDKDRPVPTFDPGVVVFTGKAEWKLHEDQRRAIIALLKWKGDVAGVNTFGRPRSNGVCDSVAYQPIVERYSDRTTLRHDSIAGKMLCTTCNWEIGRLFKKAGYSDFALYHKSYNGLATPLIRVYRDEWGILCIWWPKKPTAIDWDEFIDEDTEKVSGYRINVPTTCSDAAFSKDQTRDWSTEGKKAFWRNELPKRLRPTMKKWQER